MQVVPGSPAVPRWPGSWCLRAPSVCWFAVHAADSVLPFGRGKPAGGIEFQPKGRKHARCLTLPWGNPGVTLRHPADQRHKGLSRVPLCRDCKLSPPTTILFLALAAGPALALVSPQARPATTSTTLVDKQSGHRQRPQVVVQSTGGIDSFAFTGRYSKLWNFCQPSKRCSCH